MPQDNFDDTDELGALLHVAPERQYELVLAILAVVGLGAGVVLLMRGGDQLATLGTLGGGTLLGLSALALWQTRIECREDGVRRITAFGLHQLLYEDIASITFHQTIHTISLGSVHLITTGISYDLKLEPVRRRDGTLKFTTWMFRSNAETEQCLQTITTRVQEVVGSWMLNALGEGEDVAWTKKASITPAGLRLSKKHKGENLLPYQNLEGFWTDEHGELFAALRDGSAAKIAKITERDVWPGLWAIAHHASVAVPDPTERP